MEHKDTERKGIPPRPKARYATNNAIEEVATELNLPNEQWMQDWPCEVVIAGDIEKYITHYENAVDEDKKFLLMETILHALEMNDEVDIIKHWQRVKPLLKSDFSLHEFTVYEWSTFDTEDLASDDFATGPLVPLLRELWRSVRS